MQRLAFAVVFVFLPFTAFSQSDPDSEIEYWKGLEVRPEYTSEECESYSSLRSDYQYSSNADLVIQKYLGGYYSPYDDVWYDEATDVQVEHMVARSEAHWSGMCKQSAAMRYKYANDIENLTLCTPSVNQAKSNLDPGEWLPEHHKCWFVWTVLHVKKKYNMTIDERERDAMEDTLENCGALELFLEPENPDDT